MNVENFLIFNDDAYNLAKRFENEVLKSDKKVLVVAHSAVLRGMHYIINGIPEDGDLLKIEIPNLRIICDDAKNIIEFFGKEINTIYLTFSEPWPKKGDEKKRFTAINYLKLYDRIFKKNKQNKENLYNYTPPSLTWKKKVDFISIYKNI